MKRQIAVALLAASTLMLGACSSSSPEQSEPQISTEVATASEAEPEAPTESTTDTAPEADFDTYALSPDTVFAQDGEAGYWFASEDRGLLCIMITEGAANGPYVSCQAYPAFAVEDQACDTGSFMGTEAIMTSDGVTYGKCQSDVPLQQMCLTDPASLDESTAAFCNDNLLAAPVLPEGHGLAIAGLSCVMGKGEVECTSKSGKRMVVAPGK